METFTKGPWFHTQLVRNGKTAIYERWKEDDRSVVALHYEVVIFQPPTTTKLPDGRAYTRQESYPPSSQWGRAGWTFRTLEEAQAKFATLLKNTRRKIQDVRI